MEEREREKVFWERAQERVVREKGVVTGVVGREEEVVVKKRVEGKKGVWKRLFGAVVR